MKLDGIAMITRVVVWQRGYFRHKQGNTSCIVIVDLKFHTKRRRAFIVYKRIYQERPLVADAPNLSPFHLHQFAITDNGKC